MLTKSCEKVAPNFYCKICDYFTDRKSSFNKHLITAKHIKLTNVNENCNKSCEMRNLPTTLLTCDYCDKNFKSRVGLWKHNKKCILISPIIPPIISPISIIENEKKELIEENKQMIKLMYELKEQLTELSSKPTTIHKTTINNTFNLKFFLNETCKNALNITDFVALAKLSIEDLENTGKNGYVVGISNILTRELNILDVSKRPIHCSDMKRETIYIKDNDVWEKDNENNTKLKKVIDKIANKNLNQLQSWTTTKPDHLDYYSKQNDEYSHIIINAINNSTDVDSEKKYNKVIRAVAKTTQVL